MHRSRAASAGALTLLVLALPAQAQTTLPGFGFTTTAAAAVAYATSCTSTTNKTAAIGPVHVAQTHLMEVTHPFFHLSANRPAALRVTVTGSGTSPAVKVTGSANGTTLGSFCLKGPASLPANVNASTPSASTSFVGSVPASWLKPGLQLVITAGTASRTLTAAQLKVGAAPVLTLVHTDWLLFGDGTPTARPAGFLIELAGKLPLTALQSSNFPVPLVLPTLPVWPRSDGYTPNGVQTTQPAVLATSVPRCSSADAAAGTCTAWSGFGILASMRNLMGKLQGANGLDGLTHWYGATSANAHVGGGLGGGTTAVGDNYALVYNHELGHAFDMPHWSDALYASVASTASPIHPYTGTWPWGTKAWGGGYGNSWAYDPINGAFINPVCAATGHEMQEPMQRNGDCLAPGRIYDHFSDYSALFIHRYFVGAAAEYRSTVSSPRDFYRNVTPPFAFPAKSGRPNLDLGTTPPTLRAWNPATASYAALTPATLSSDSRVWGERYPLQWNVPVYTLWGSVSITTPSINVVRKPLSYLGHLKRIWDPTSPADFTALKSWVSGDAFWWGADLVAKAEFSDGSVQHALVKEWIRGTDPLDSWTFAHWAVNIPAPTGKTLTRVAVYHRPMEVRYSDGGNTASSYYTAENLNSTRNAGVTAANYMSTAKLLASWVP